MTVRELINRLESFDQDLLVVGQLYSEHILLYPKQIKVVELCEPRNDDWVHDARPDKPTRKYLKLPGN